MKNAVDRSPLLAMVGELFAAGSGDSVILAAPPRLGRPPFRRHQALSLEAMEDRVKHAVGPLQVAAGELADTLDNGVAVAVALSQNGEDKRR